VPTEQDWSEDRALFAGGRVAEVGPLAGEFVRLAENLLTATTVHGVLDRVVNAARVAIPGADLVSVTLATETGYTTPVHTDDMALKLDEVQYRLGEGPCVEATRTPGLGFTFSADLAQGVQFPNFGPAAAEIGAHSVLAVGLFPDGAKDRFGALNVYAFEAGGLDELDRDLALILAAHASTALAATLATTAAELESAQLRQALQSRDVIGQAKGILMERRGITADEAFDVLRRASQSLNIKLTTVAQTLVDRRAEI
jgi:GAF domain-containing protein